MIKTQDVLLACRRFDVVVTYHPYEGLTPIEAHLLRAVVAGADTFEAVATHLRLAQRLVLDACVDLLAAGLLEIAPDGRLVLADLVRERMGDPKSPSKGWEDSFATAAAPEPRTVPLLQETVTGAVFRAPPRAPYDRTRLPILPPDPDLRLVEEIPSTELLFAVLARPPRLTADVEDERATADVRARADARIGDVRLRRATGIATGLGVVDVGQELLHVELTATQPDEASTPRFQLAGPSTVPAMIRRRIATGLGNLWERGVGREPGQIFDRLDFATSSGLTDGTPPVGDPFTDVVKLEAAVDTQSKAPSLEAHDTLRDVERDVSESVARAAQCAATVDLVVGARLHHEAMARALREARQQVVLACPWVQRLSVDHVRSQIEAAVSRGVVVCLLWGIERGEALDEGAKKFLLGLARHPSGGGIIIADRSAQSHAKVIACDHNWLIVSSCNFLNSGPERTTEELGIQLTSPPGRVDPNPDDLRTAPSHSMSEILRWVREAMPDFRLQQRIIDSPTLLQMAERSNRPPPLVNILAPQVDVPITIKLWIRTWRQRAAELRQQLESARPIAMPVRDLEHRELLIYALEHARRRLYVESPDVAAAGLSEPVALALKRASSRGVDVRLRYHQRSVAGDEGDSHWRSLAGAGVTAVKADTHAKVLVCDDWAIVGSFNFLSFAGRGRRELGVRVFDTGMADRLSARFTPG